jgi:hypothetical protein
VNVVSEPPSTDTWLNVKRGSKLIGPGFRMPTRTSSGMPIVNAFSPSSGIV